MTENNTAQRLQETAAKCLSSLDAWNNDLENTSAKEALLAAVHDLRKVTSRLEIDIALNERKVVNAKPLPIPEHKSKVRNKNQKPLSEILPVAQIKEAGKKRKIAIEEAKANKEQSSKESISPKDSVTTDEKTAEKIHRPRRKKRDDNASE